MGFRTVVIQSSCRLSYKDGFLIMRGNEVQMIHLSEIHTLIIDSTMTTVTGYLMCELMKEKINVIFCDEKRNPIGSVHPLYGSYDTAGRVIEQTTWSESRKAILGQAVIRQKIRNQAFLLELVDSKAASMIYQYSSEIIANDETNREGHAAKVYFNRIFGDNFIRGIKSDRNAALDYGYSLLLSLFNKEITARGYTTQIGIHHHNPTNPYNLSSDLMEPFRCFVDRLVLQEKNRPFDREYKCLLLSILQQEVIYEGQHMMFTTAITRYVRNATEYLSGRIEWSEEKVIHLEEQANESHSHV